MHARLLLLLLLIATPLRAETAYPSSDLVHFAGGVRPGNVTFARLSATARNGALRYCTDCTAGNPCTGSGTGALARRENGVWNCGGGAGGGSSAFSAITSGTNTSATMTCGTGCTLNTSGAGVVAASTAAALASDPGDCPTNQATVGVNAAGTAQSCFQPVLISGTPANDRLGVWTSATTQEGDPNLTFDGTTRILRVGQSGATGRVRADCVAASSDCYEDFTDNATHAAAPTSAGITRQYSFSGRRYLIVNGGAGAPVLTDSSTDVLTNKVFNTASVGNSLLIDNQAITDTSGTASKVATVSGTVVDGNYARWDATGNLVDAGAPGGSTPRLDQILDPTANKSFAMTTRTLGFTFGDINAATSFQLSLGALTTTPNVTQVSIVDATGNTNTGPLVSINTVGTSTAPPLRVTAQGTANGVQMSTAGVLSPIGTGQIAPRLNDVTNPTASKTFTVGNQIVEFLFGSATETSQMFVVNDSPSNTGTGPLFLAATQSASNAVPVRFCARGTANCVEMNTAASLFPSGTGKISPRWNDLTASNGALVLTDGSGSEFRLTAAGGTWAWNTTGSGSTGTTDKFTFTDHNSNTGTGALVAARTASGSSMKPFEACVGGTTNCVRLNNAGVFEATGTASIATGPLTCPTTTWIPSAFAPPSGTPANVSTGGTAGQLRCYRMRQQCTKTGATQVGWRVATGSATHECAVAIYNSTGTTLIAKAAAQLCDANNTDESDTAVASFNLTGGTDYLVCHATSVATTILVQGMNNALGNVLTDQFVQGPTTAADVAQFNAACTAASTPYSCCTGAQTGTCTGMPASVGTLSGMSGTLGGIYLVVE